MRSHQLQEAIGLALGELIGYADELRDLDQALGDGDLGITVSLGAKAVIGALAELPDDASPTEIARTCAKAFANANPSTMAALVAGGLLAGSRGWAALEDVSFADAGKFAQLAGENIANRGKTQLGDKTILDAIMPAAAALQNATDAATGLDAAIDAARRAVDETTPLQSRRGRASWLQERSIGLQDPGATAFLRFLESWRDANGAGDATGRG